MLAEHLDLFHGHGPLDSALPLLFEFSEVRGRVNDDDAILISIVSVILDLRTDLFHGSLVHEDVVFIVDRGGVSLVVLVGVIDDLEGLHMFLESLDLRDVDHLGGLDGVHFLIVIVVLIEVLEYKGGPVLPVSNVLLYVLNLLNQEELIFLGQII